MRMYAWSRAAVAVLFLIGIVGYAVINLTVQQDELQDGLARIDAPSSLGEVTRTTASLEALFNDALFERNSFIELYSYLQVVMDKQENGNFDLVRSNSGHLVYGDFFHEVPETIPEQAHQVYLLQQYAAQYDCEVIFVATQPLHVEGAYSYDSGLPFKDDNPDVDAMLYYLQSLGVDCLDSREVLRQSDLEPSEYRYLTDHHWTVEASFEVHRALTEKLNEDYGEDLDPDGVITDLSQYSQIVYEDAFVGTLARRAGIPFAGTDDFSLILPNFETSYRVEENLGYETVNREGPFDSSLIVSAYLHPSDSYLASPYTSYLGGSVPHRLIVNQTNPTGPKVLFVQDSFGLPLASFFAANTSELEMVWPFSDTLYAYTEDMQLLIQNNIEEYDYIFVSLTPDNYNTQGFNFVPAG